MTSAVIVDAVRTPLGKRNGSLKDWHPVDLAAHTLEALATRNDLDPAVVDDVIMGCVSQAGEQTGNIGRNAVLAAGFPETVPGTSVDRQCGSSQQAIHFAAQGVLAGAYDVVVAAGVESMTRVPMGASVLPGSNMFGPRVTARYDLVPQGISAERIADKWGITRDDADAFALRSQELAAKATAAGHFTREILAIDAPIVGDDGKPTGATKRVSADQGIRPTTREALAALKPVQPDGIHTPGNSSQVSDGAAGLQILEFDVPEKLTADGELNLRWTRQPGLGGNGRGCQVAEVFLIKKQFLLKGWNSFFFFNPADFTTLPVAPPVGNPEKAHGTQSTLPLSFGHSGRVPSKERCADRYT
jgi:acetyl-CoA acetyltransferase family protein